jgi:hypothetical protein
MMMQVLAPGMEHAEQADVGSKVLRVACHFEQRCRAGAEEQVVKQPLVLKHKSGEFMRQCEDDVEVGHRQQLGRARGQPSGASVALALGAVPVAARVIRDGLMATAGAPIAMTAQSCRATTDDGVHHLAVLPGVMRAVPLPEAVAGCAEDVGHLKGGSAHRCTRLLECFTSLGVETASASSGLATACR